MISRIKPILPDLLENAKWRGCRVRFARPFVNRIFCLHEELRVCLHEIELCEPDQSMWHSHPWDTEFLLVKGDQLVGMGYDVEKTFHGQGYTLAQRCDIGKNSPRQVGRLILSSGDSYSMKSIIDWHFVRPLNATSYSLMVNGPQIEQRKRPDGFGDAMSEEDVDNYKTLWKKLLLESSDK